MAAAARELGVVPSALTYRIRQVEDALDVLLFDRSSRQAKLTEAGKELLREGNRLLMELDAVANRVKRVATGWEPQFTLAVDSVISGTTIMELCEAFLHWGHPRACGFAKRRFQARWRRLPLVRRTWPSASSLNRAPPARCIANHWAISILFMPWRPTTH